MKLYETLKKLCYCHGVSGREEKIRDLLGEIISPYCDEMRTDSLGNLIAVKKGSGRKKIALCAHMDEIGFLVTFIEDNGMLRVAPVGGISLTASAFSRVVSEKGIKGVIAPDDKVKAADYKAETFYIDIGAKNKKRAESKVAIGDFFVVTPSLERLLGNRICGRPLDDRIGCAILVEIAKALWKTPLEDDVYYVFSVQEEVGCRGSQTAAFSIRPDVALCFDVTATGDTPGASPMVCSLGGGAAVKIKDSSVICDSTLTKRLCDIAESRGIPHQREILLFGGTDTSSMQLTAAGAAAGALSVPTRFIHSGVETCDLGDAECCIKLAIELIKSGV